MHQSTILAGVLGLMTLFCSATLAAIVKLRGSNPRSPRVILPLTVIALVGVVILGTAVSKEIWLEHRDTAAQTQLAQAGIEMIGADWGDDNLMVVKAQGCTATFQIKQGASPGAWPLVSGTGHTDADSGCGSKDLDKLFAPR